MGERIILLTTIGKGDDCWNWSAAKFPDGYGLMGDRAGFEHKAHRASYEAFIGKIPKGMSVLHSCDNPSCVRPSHLFLGTQDDNMKDAKNKLRICVGSAKINFEIAENIRARHVKKSDGMNGTKALAKEFGISKPTVYQILNKQRWSKPIPKRGPGSRRSTNELGKD